MYRKPRPQDFAIAINATTSGVIYLGNSVVGAIKTPDAMTGDELSFLVAESDDEDFVPLYDSNGNKVTATISTSEARGCSLSGAEADAFAVWAYCKVVSDETELAARALVIVTM